MTTSMSVQNNFIRGEVFRIKVSDGIAQPLGSQQKVNLYPAGVLTEAYFCKSLGVLIVLNDHSNESAN